MNIKNVVRVAEVIRDIRCTERFVGGSFGEKAAEIFIAHYRDTKLNYEKTPSMYDYHNLLERVKGGGKVEWRDIEMLRAFRSELEGYVVN